ncbi:MAG: TatD family hydrolase [Nitrososphaeria archaeon]
MLIDSHAHLAEDELKPFLEWILASCRNNDIVVFTNSSSLKSSRMNIALAKSSRGLVKAFVGFHPWEAGYYDDEAFKDLVMTRESDISGIGEIGLDGKHVINTPMEAQKKAFERQLETAEKLKLPVCIHSRRAQDEVLDSLESFSLKGVLLHWFSGGTEQMKRGLNRGYFFGFGPTIIYSKSAQKLLKSCDPHRVLLETDSPVCYEACFENRMSTPLLIHSVVYAVSNIFKKSLEETLNIILENSQNYIGRRIGWR